MRFIRNFMLVLGPVSSVFDFLTFGLLLLVFHASEPKSAPIGEVGLGLPAGHRRPAKPI
jgi:hypothetical protein